MLVCFATTDSIGVFEIGEFGDLTFVRSITAPSVTDNPWKAPDGSVYFAGATLGVEAFYKPMGEYHAGSEISILPPDQERVPTLSPKLITIVKNITFVVKK